jgi:hypothetical protein
MPVSARSCRTNAIILKRTSTRDRKPSKRFLVGTSMHSKTRSTRIKASTKLAAIVKNQAARRTIVNATRMGWLVYPGGANVSTAKMSSHVESMSLMSHMSLCWIQSRRYSSIMRVCRIVRLNQEISLINKGNLS